MRLAGLLNSDMRPLARGITGSLLDKAVKSKSIARRYACHKMLAPLPKDISLDRRAANVPRRFHWLAFIVASLAAALVLVSMVAIPQWLSKQARWEALRSHVGEIGQIAASVVDGDLHRKLLDPANYSDELYARALRPLVRFHSADPNIFYLYTMVDRDGVAYFVLDTAASPDLRTDHKLRASAYMERFDLREEYKNDDWLQSDRGR